MGDDAHVSGMPFEIANCGLKRVRLEMGICVLFTFKRLLCEVI